MNACMRDNTVLDHRNQPPNSADLRRVRQTTIIWQDGFKLRAYMKAESDIRLLGDKIAEMNTFLLAP